MDDIIARVKSYIDAGTCEAVSISDYSEAECGDRAVSLYQEFVYKNRRVVVSNNVRRFSLTIFPNCFGQIPDHPAESDMLAPNPNIRCPGLQFIQLPLDPAKGRQIMMLYTICTMALQERA